jgi:predicted nucleotide-binding protein
VILSRNASPYIGDILDMAMRQVQAVVVLLTGDDEARLRGEFVSVDDADYERELTPQPRPNVIFEAGLALGRFPDRTILVQVGKLRPFSDIAGRHSIRFKNTVKARQELAQRLKIAGCPVDLSGTDWHDAGLFGG